MSKNSLDSFLAPKSTAVIGASELVGSISQLVSADTVAKWRAELSAADGLLGEFRSKALLADYGIPITKTTIARSVTEAVAMAEQLGYPVALRVISVDIPHDTDVGAVVLNIANADGIRTHYTNMMGAIAKHSPTAQIEGVAVEQMVPAARGVELLVGMTHDPQFGPVLVLGGGGVTAKLQSDTVIERGPFDDLLIDRMLRTLRLYPLLEGDHGRPGVNLVLLRETIARFIRLIQDFPDLASAEINPLLATPEMVVALGARMNSSISKAE